jgi:hypothetical protein
VLGDAFVAMRVQISGYNSKRETRLVSGFVRMRLGPTDERVLGVRAHRRHGEGHGA